MNISNQQKLDFYYDDTGFYSYIMLNCTDLQLTRVIDSLNKSGIKTLHKGNSFRPASNNRQYQWFVRVGDRSNRPNNDQIDIFFDKVFGVISESRHIEKLKNLANRLLSDMDDLEEKKNKLEQDKLHIESEYEKFTELADDENQALKNKIKAQLIENDILKGKLEKQEKEFELCKTEKEIDRREISSQSVSRVKDDILLTINSLLPNITFLRDSIDNLVNEVDDLSQPLKKLWEIAYRPGNLKAERFERAPKFKELHFGGDGRIYFKHQKDKTEVLVSFKQQQKLDERYLKEI